MLLPNFSEWLVGAGIILVITTVLFVLNLLIIPTGHFNYVEWFGIVMFFITINTGRLTFNQSVKVNKFIREQVEKGIDEKSLTVDDYFENEKQKENNADIS
jgi:hypothetical protein